MLYTNRSFVGVEMVQTVICLKWENKYSSDYVNKLYSMVNRNTSRPLRFVCFTDDPTGIIPDVEIMDMPPFTLPEYMRFHPFRRMFIWDKTLADFSGNILHLDLDTVVTNSIDEFFDFKPEATFCVPENWTQKGQGIGNMSVFRFKVGAHPYLWEKFSSDPDAAKREFRNSQTFVCRNIKEIVYFPQEWCLSFKHSLLPTWPLNLFLTARLPEDTKVVAFHGTPEVHHCIAGEWPTKAAWKKIYKFVKPTPWVAEHWR